MSFRKLFGRNNKDSQTKQSDLPTQAKTSTQQVITSLNTTNNVALSSLADQSRLEDLPAIQTLAESQPGTIESCESSFRVSVNEYPIQLNLIPDSENPKGLRTKTSRQMPSLPNNLTAWLDNFMNEHPILDENDKIFIATFLVDELNAAQAISQTSTVSVLEQIYVEHEKFKSSNRHPKHYLAYVATQAEIKARSEQIIYVCTRQPHIAIECVNAEIRENEIRKDALIKQIDRTELNKTVFSILNPMSWKIKVVDDIYDNETIRAATKLHNSLVIKIRGILAQAKQIQIDSPDYTLNLGAQTTLLTIYSNQISILINRLETPLEIDGPIPSMRYEQELSKAQNALIEVKNEVALLEEILEKQNRIAALQTQRLIATMPDEEPKSTKSWFGCIKR